MVPGSLKTLGELLGVNKDTSEWQTKKMLVSSKHMLLYRTSSDLINNLSYEINFLNLINSIKKTESYLFFELKINFIISYKKDILIILFKFDLNAKISFGGIDFSYFNSFYRR